MGGQESNLQQQLHSSCAGATTELLPPAPPPSSKDPHAGGEKSTGGNRRLAEGGKPQAQGAPHSLGKTPSWSLPFPSCTQKKGWGRSLSRLFPKTGIKLQTRGNLREP